MFPYNPFRATSHWSPYGVRSMMHDFDDFDSFLDNSAALRLRDNAGHLKLSNDGQSFEYRVNVSGYRPEEVKVDLEEDTVVIQVSF